MYISFSQNEEIVAVHLNLITVFRTEQDLIAFLRAADIRTSANHFTPHQSLLLLSRSRYQNPSTTSPFSLVTGHADEDAIMQHFDRALKILVCGDVFRFFSHYRTVPFLDMNPDAGTPQKTNFTASDGVSLEAECLIPESTKAVAVLSHPHPLYGGDMRNNVVQALFEALPQASIATLRYNFRGVQNSGGSHGEGRLELLDCQAAFSHATNLAASTPVFSVGYSFGADVSLSADSSSLAGWVGIASPLALLAPSEMKANSDSRPTLLLVPKNDQYRSFAEAQEISSDWTATTVQELATGDHFLFGETQQVTELVSSFVTDCTAEQ